MNERRLSDDDIERLAARTASRTVAALARLVILVLATFAGLWILLLLLGMTVRTVGPSDRQGPDVLVGLVSFAALVAVLVALVAAWARFLRAR